MKFLFYFSIFSTVWIFLSTTHETSVLACIFNKDTSRALCRACADGWRGAAFQGNATVGPVDTRSLGLTAGGGGTAPRWFGCFTRI